MKAHIPADRDRKLLHIVVVMAAYVADIARTAELLHGEEQQVHAVAGYTDVEKRPEMVAMTRKHDWQIASKHSLLKALAQGAEKEVRKAVEKAKASVRAIVEHPLSDFEEFIPASENSVSRTAKNGHHLYALFGLADVVIAPRRATA